MKRLFLLSALALITLGAAAQGRIETKKYKLADFTTKTTKIVLTGNDMIDAALRKDVTERWNLTPFEFCTQDEFARIRTSSQYYFLTFVNGPAGPEGEAGLTFLTLRKGGPEAEKGPGEMLEAVTVPFSPSGAAGSRSFTLLPALIDLIQAFVPKAMESDRAGYAGIQSICKNLQKTKDKRVLLPENELAPGIPPKVRERCLDEHFLAVSEDEADHAFNEEESDTLVGFLIAPLDPSRGATTYKLLIDAATHELYYFKQEKTGKDGETGFDADDLRKISSRK